MTRRSGMSRLVGLALACSGCSSTIFSEGQGRAHQGAVHILRDGGTKRTKLQMDPGYPQLELSSRFDLQVAGRADDERHSIRLRIELLRQLPRYSFPEDKQELQVTATRGEQQLRIDTITGFLEVKARDEEGVEGSAIVSVALHDASGYPAVELDLFFGQRAESDGG